jgi:hypothetical protein
MPVVLSLWNLTRLFENFDQNKTQFIPDTDLVQLVNDCVHDWTKDTPYW